MVQWTKSWRIIMAVKKKITVPIKIIANAVEEADDNWNHYLDIEKMEVIMLPGDDFFGDLDEEDQEMNELIEEGWNIRFFGLPSKYDIHEYSIMERFIWSLPEGQMQDNLGNAIRGRGAFRRFKDECHRYGIIQKWYEYQADAYKRIAIEWCEAHGFDYTDEDEKPTKPEKSDSDKAKKDPLAWEEVGCEHLIQDEWIDFRRSVYRFPDGSTFQPFYSYSRRDYVVIVASDEEGNYLCVRQFRQGIKVVTTEFPAGGIERKDGKEYGKQDVSAEDALAAAKRELLEETGYESDEWKHLLTVPSNATIADNYGHLFVAKNCRKVSGQSLDETEFLDVKKLSADEIEDLILTGNFQQAIHITAWLLAQRET